MSERERGERVPPGLLRWLLLRALPGRDRHELIAELDELYAARANREGVARAGLWYLRQCVSFPVRRLRYWVVRSVTRASTGEPSQNGRGAGMGMGHGGFGFFMETIVSDVRHAVRGLQRRPVYAITSVLTLALGIAAVSSIYAVANWVLLRPVPHVRGADELVRVYLGEAENDRAYYHMSHPFVLDLVADSRLLGNTAATAVQDVHFSVAESSSPERVSGEIVTGNYFDVLGVTPGAGRLFRADDDRPGAPAVAVVSERLARRHWPGRVPVGEAVNVNGSVYTVVGVAPASFHGADLPGMSDIWFPAAALPELIHAPTVLTNRGGSVWPVLISRPRPGTTVAALNTELNRLLAAWRETYGSLSLRQEIRTFAGIGTPASYRRLVSRTLAILAVAAGFLLLLSCANVANLGLARAATLRTSTAVRRALGAAGSRIVGERLLESLIVGGAGAVVGFALAWASLAALRGTSFALVGVPLDDVQLDARVLFFTALAGLLAGVLAGVFPAVRLRREAAAQVLRTARHGDRRSVRVRAGLVIAQVAISAVLLVGAGLLARTLMNLRHVDLGFERENVLTFTMVPSLQGYDRDRTLRLVRDYVTALRQEPGIASAAAVWAPPFQSFYIPRVVKRPDADWDNGRVRVRSFQVTPSFFEAAGVPLLAGRTFTDGEALQMDSTAPALAILNESAVRAIFPGIEPRDAAGRTIEQRTGEDPITVLVVGVVADARFDDVASPSQPYYFVPWAQGADLGRIALYVKTRGNPLGLASRARAIGAELDAGLPVRGLRTLEQDIDVHLAEERLVTSLATVLALAGLALAAIGLYGVLAFAVAERTREIGIRAALGAMPARLVALFIRGGLVLTGTGAIIGLIGAAYLGRFLESRLFGVASLDPGTYVGGILLLLLAAALASWIPARRALRVDPMIALRQD